MNDTDRSLGLNQKMLLAGIGAFLLQLAWGFTVRYPAVLFPAMLGPLEIVPFVLAWHMAESQRWHAGRSALIGIGIFACLFIYLALVGLGMEHYQAPAPGAKCGGPPIFGFVLLAAPVLQLLVLGFVRLLACVFPNGKSIDPE